MARVPATGEILRGPEQGFSAPVEGWLRGPLLAYGEEMLLVRPRGVSVFFRPQAVRALRQKHRTGHEIHGIHIWALLVFEVWFRTWMNGHRVA
jgi:asparagine synthase (glutamine-hydrolysing)